MSSRPRIAIVGRFTEHASAIRYAGVVSARRLLESVWAAGGEPLTFLPVENPDWAQRLDGIAGVLLAGGGDVNPARYGQTPETEELYGIDDLQDDNDFSLAKYALENGVPTLAICRGFQIVNVVRGGTLVQHMPKDHRHHLHQITLGDGAENIGLSQLTLEASCYHHQALDQLGQGLQVLARSAEGNVEAVRIDAANWAFGVQWHPEDNSDSDAQQAELFARFIAEARNFSS